MKETPSIEKVMFEIYRDADDSLGVAYRVVYFTDLSEDERETEIDRAMAGDHVYDGFLPADDGSRGKAQVAKVLALLNEGESMSEDRIEEILAPYEVDAG